MKAIKITLVLLSFWMMVFFVTEAAFARSQSLSTTIVVIVKANPQSNLSTNDKSAGILGELAVTQSMLQPYIKVNTRETNSQEKIYTIIDKL